MATSPQKGDNTVADALILSLKLIDNIMEESRSVTASLYDCKANLTELERLEDRHYGAVGTQRAEIEEAIKRLNNTVLARHAETRKKIEHLEELRVEMERLVDRGTTSPNA